MLDGERLTFGVITPALIYTAAFCGLGGPHLTVLAHGPSFSSRGGTMSMSIIFLDVKGRGARYIHGSHWHRAAYREDRQRDAGWGNLTFSLVACEGGTDRRAFDSAARDRLFHATPEIGQMVQAVAPWGR